MQNRFDEQHPSSELLVRWLDGELDRGLRAAMGQHLEICWGCRHKQEQLRRTMDAYAEMAGDGWDEDREAQPGRWGGFSSKLNAAAKERRPAHRLAASYAGGLAAGMFATAVLLLWPVEIVSAKEAISRSSAAERAMEARSPLAVMVQGIRVETPKGKASGRVWRSAAQWRATGDDPLWQELETVYREHALDFSRPVSAANHSAFLRANPNCREQVDQEGAFFRIRMHASEGSIIDAELVIRAADWHAVEQSWTVRDDDETRRYRVIETGFEVATLTPQLATWMGGDAPTVVAQLAPVLAAAIEVTEPTALPEPAMEAWKLDEAEVEALAAVHDSGAAYRDGARVERQGNRILITTYPESPAARKALEQRLSLDYPIVVAESVGDATSAEASALVASPPLAPLFFDSLVRMTGRESTAQLMVSAHHAALRRVQVETSALADLLHRFPEPTHAGLTPHSAGKLARLGTEHLASARAAWQQASATSRPLLAAASLQLPEPQSGQKVCSWTGANVELPRIAGRLDELYSRGFTALAGGSDDVRHLPLPRLQEELLQLQASLSGALTGACEQ